MQLRKEDKFDQFIVKNFKLIFGTLFILGVVSSIIVTYLGSA